MREPDITVPRWATLVFILVVALAGCSAIPFVEPTPQKEPAPVMLVNNASLTETFTVAVIEEGEDIIAIRSNNQSANYTIGPGASTIENSDTHPFTRIEFPGSARIHGKYTLEPGMRKQLSVENVAPDEAIVILIYDKPEGTYRAIHSVSCGGPLLGVKATSRTGGSEDWTTGTHECG